MLLLLSILLRACMRQLWYAAIAASEFPRRAACESLIRMRRAHLHVEREPRLAQASFRLDGVDGSSTDPVQCRRD